MTDSMWTGRVRRLVIVNLLAGAAVLLAMAAPQPITSGALGSEWRCSKAGFVLTTCPSDPARLIPKLLAQTLWFEFCWKFQPSLFSKKRRQARIFETGGGFLSE